MRRKMRSSALLLVFTLTKMVEKPSWFLTWHELHMKGYHRKQSKDVIIIKKCTEVLSNLNSLSKEQRSPFLWWFIVFVMQLSMQLAIFWFSKNVCTYLLHPCPHLRMNSQFLRLPISSVVMSHLSCTLFWKFIFCLFF